MYLCQGVTRNYDMTVSLFRNSCYLEQLNARRSAESSSQFKVVLVILNFSDQSQSGPETTARLGLFAASLDTTSSHAWDRTRDHRLTADCLTAWPRENINPVI